MSAREWDGFVEFLDRKWRQWIVSAVLVPALLSRNKYGLGTKEDEDISGGSAMDLFWV